MALGEWSRGAGRDRRFVLGMVVSTGIGGGLILDGAPFHGRTGNAGHVGHVVVEPGGEQQPAELATALDVHVALRLPQPESQLVEAPQERLVRPVEDQPSVVDRAGGDETAGSQRATDLSETSQRIVQRLQHREQRAHVDGTVGHVELVDAPLPELHVVDPMHGRVGPRIRKLGPLQLDPEYPSGDLRERVELEPDPLLAQSLLRLDERASYVAVLDQSLAERDPGRAREADRRRRAGVGDREHEVGVDG